jgi:hypothetical protein
LSLEGSPTNFIRRPPKLKYISSLVEPPECVSPYLNTCTQRGGRGTGR